MKDNISERNPDLEEMRERGWAWIAVNGHAKHGAPHTDDSYAARQVHRHHPSDDPEYDPDEYGSMTYQELRIVSFE